MNNRPLNKNNPRNIKCEHCEHFAESSETRRGYHIMKCKCQNSKWHNEERCYGIDVNALSGTKNMPTQPRKAVRIMGECKHENCPMRNGEVSTECKFDDCPYRHTDRPSWEGLILFFMKKAFEGKSQPPEAEN